jgi:hypothetical protein
VTPPTPTKFLVALEMLKSEWTRDPARPAAIVHPRLGYRVTLGVLAARLEYGHGDDWHTVDAPFHARATAADRAHGILADLLRPAPPPPRIPPRPAA